MNTQKNTQVVKRLFENFLSLKIPAILKDLTEDVEWIYPGAPDIEFAGVFKGKKAVQEFYKRLNDTTEIETFTIEQYIAQDDAVAVTGYHKGNSLITDNEFESEWVMVFQLQNGKIKRCQTYIDTAKMSVAFWIA